MNPWIASVIATAEIFSFPTRATHAAGFVAAFVATPGLVVVDAESQSVPHDLGLGDIRIRRQQPYAVPRTCAHRSVHRLHKLRATIRIDGMVAGVVGEHDILQFLVLRDTCRDR